MNEGDKPGVREAYHADYIFWLKKKTWDPVEAAMLLAGFEPEGFHDGEGIWVEFQKKTDGIHRLIAESIAAKEIDVRSSPSKWLSWSTKKELKLPDQLTLVLEGRHAEPASHDVHPIELTATRDQLIDAFGTFTGMDKFWFRNLKDTPALHSARKRKGVGSKHSTQPLFCPYEVMIWLIDSKRKKGRNLSPETGWRRLKQCFPTVHQKHEIEDPNTYD